MDKKPFLLYPKVYRHPQKLINQIVLTHELGSFSELLVLYFTFFDLIKFLMKYKMFLFRHNFAFFLFECFALKRLLLLSSAFYQVNFAVCNAQKSVAMAYMRF